MTDIDTAMPSTLAPSTKVDTTRSPSYYFPPAGHPDARVVAELNLYIQRRTKHKYFVRVHGESLADGAYEIHEHATRKTTIGEVIRVFELTVGAMGTILLRQENSGMLEFGSSP